MLISAVLHTYCVFNTLLQYLMVNLHLKTKSILTDLCVLGTNIEITYLANDYCLIFIKRPY